jgi:type IV pilus assembly protein PilM
VNPEALSAVMNAVNTEVAGEVTRSIDYFRTASAQENIHRVVLCGGAARSSGLVALLGERLGVPVELANPFNQIEIDKKAFNVDEIHEIAPQAAVGVGLAIRKMGDR